MGVKTHVGPDGQEIAHAVVMAHQASPIVYKDDYNKNVLGQGPANPAIAFPENDRLKKIHDQTTKPKYEKDAKEMLRKNILPVDAPEFKRARETAKIASDKEYNKQRAQTVHDYRGYQTMDSRVHPDVVRGQKASDLISDKKYKLDWESEKDVVYFPYTITQEYDDKYEQKRHREDYKHDYEKTKDKNHYDITDTPVYGQIKDHNIQTNDLNYKQDFEKNKGKMLGTDVTPEMARAQELEPIRNKQLYESDARSKLPHTNVDADGQQIAHAIHMTNQASDIAYKSDYKKDVLGKSTKDPAIAYPEHDRLKKIHDATNKAAYQKDSKAQNKHNVYPVDAMEFKRATEAAKNASDKNYKKQLREIIDTYHGYQTMDSRVHPDVVRGQKAHNLISDIVYNEDYRNSKEVVIFPC